MPCATSVYFHIFSVTQRSICRGVGGFNPLLVEEDPHTGDWKFLSGGVGFDPPPVPIQQDQLND